MKRPELREVPLKRELSRMAACAPDIFITVDPGQWDHMLSAGYEADATLLEIENDRFIRAFKKTDLP